MAERPPDHPAGACPATGEYDEQLRQELTEAIRQAPRLLREAVAGLSDPQLDSLYRNWTIRQIVHHISDSHIHSYIRFKWALTEDEPTIKAYDEADWVQLGDARTGSVEPPLALLDGLHAKWSQMLEHMSADDFRRTFVHPQTGETVCLWTALNYYPWHSRHHTGQILWIREQRGW